jgi:competence ComEA-like helix-hairpin-helix protein
MFRKLSVIIGLTETEIKILLFLVTAFLVGFSYKTFFEQVEENTEKVFDYSKEDSLFFAAGDEPEQTDSVGSEDKPIDYKQEVLDFSPPNFSESNSKVTPAEKSINLNSANLDELILLPGIGKKTAERIIELRSKRGKFKSLKELSEIKGIGETKFQNIIRYLYIE